MINHYRKAKEEGWKPDTFRAKITFIDKEQFTIEVEGSWWNILEYGVKYSSYSMTTKWKIFKNEEEIDSFSYYDFFTSIQEIKENIYGHI